MDKSLLNRTFTYEGTTAAGILLLSNECLKISDAAMADWKVLLAAGAFTVGGILLDKLYKENKYEKLFRMCGIENRDKQVPVIIKKQTNGIETTLVIHLPAGISQKHFEAKHQELEQFLNAKIELGYNKNLIMELIDNNLKTEYKYVFEECDSPLKIYCAETNRGKFYLDIEKCPHILLAGETGSGKSTFLDTIRLSLIQSK
jgi:S-DNA-T family DNA segregation ATPase FtsK/SpoIIIE